MSWLASLALPELEGGIWILVPQFCDKTLKKTDFGTTGKKNTSLWILVYFLSNFGCLALSQQLKQQKEARSKEARRKEARRKKPASCLIDLSATPHHPVDQVDLDCTEPPPETAFLKWSTATISLGTPGTLLQDSTATSVAREDLCPVWRWRAMPTGGSEASSATKCTQEECREGPGKFVTCPRTSMQEF